MKEMTVLGYYRGALDEVGTLKGNEKVCFMVDGINGDESDEWDVEKGIDEVIDIYKKCGAELSEEGLFETEDMDYTLLNELLFG